MVIEVMGRYAGWIALYAGVAGTGCANSTGGGGRLLPSGTGSVLIDDLRFAAVGLPAGTSAILFAGSGTLSLPFGDGLRCAGGQLRRLAGQREHQVEVEIVEARRASHGHRSQRLRAVVDATQAPQGVVVTSRSKSAVVCTTTSRSWKKATSSLPASGMKTTLASTAP